MLATGRDISLSSWISRTNDFTISSMALRGRKRDGEKRVKRRVREVGRRKGKGEGRGEGGREKGSKM